MAMLEARPKGWLSWRFELCAGGRAIVSMDMAWLTEGGSFVWEGVEYGLSREGLWSGDFVLQAGGDTPARAAKPSAFLRRFDVHVGSRHLTLEAASALTRKFHLVENGSVVGAVTPLHPFSRRCTIVFPDDLTLPVQVFLFWLVALIWRRAANAAAASAGS